MTKSTFRLVIVAIVLVLLVGALVSLKPPDDHDHDIRQVVIKDENIGCLYHYYEKCKTCDYFKLIQDTNYHEYVDGVCIFCNVKNTVAECLHPEAWGLGCDTVQDSCIMYSYDWYCPDCNEYGGYQEYCVNETGESTCKCDPCKCTRTHCYCEED